MSSINMTTKLSRYSQRMSYTKCIKYEGAFEDEMASQKTRKNPNAFKKLFSVHPHCVMAFASISIINQSF